MSTRTYLWALACICIEIVLVGATPRVETTAGGVGAGPPPSRTARELELELELARQESLYLRLDSAGQRLEVKARGVVLDEMPLRGVALLGYRPARGGSARAAVELPAVWTVAEDAAAAYRRVVAPAALRPYVRDEATSAPPNVEEGPLPEPPDVYRVALDPGWSLKVTTELPSGGWSSRILHALGDGWARLRHRPVNAENLIVVAVDSEDARRLHHLFRDKLPILVTLPAGES